MQSRDSSASGGLGHRIGSKPAALGAIAAGALFLYVWRAIDPRLIFHGAGTISNFPVFRTGFGALRDSLARPGGMVEYATAFLAQLFVSSWAGAAVIVGLGWALFRATDAAIRLIGAPSLRFLRFAGPVALAITFARYRFEIQPYLAFVTSAGLAVVARRLSFRLRILWVVLGSLASYHLAGGAYVVYTVCGASYEGSVRERRRRGAVVLATLVLTPLVMGMLAFGYGAWDAYTLLLPFSPASLVRLLVPTSTKLGGGFGGSNSLIEILTAAGFCLLCLVPIVATGLHHLVRSGAAASRRPREREGRWRFSVSGAVALAAAIAGLALLPDHRQRAVIESDYLAHLGRWSELLERAPDYANVPLVLNSVNRALFHTGALADRMFEFRQTGGGVLLLGRDAGIPFSEDTEFRAPGLWRRAQLHMDLGLLGVAQKELVVLVDWIGARPLVMRDLALIALAAGDVGTARITLGDLSKSLFDADWAAEKLALLDDPDRLAADPEVCQLRSRMCSTEGTSSMLAVLDIYDTYLDDAQTLERVLADYPDNRLALEYLLALHLLDRRLDAFAAALAARRDSLAGPLPARFQEALLLAAESDGKAAREAGFVPDPAMVERLTAYRSWRATRAEAGKRAARAGGDYQATYWRYYDDGKPSGVGP